MMIAEISLRTKGCVFRKWETVPRKAGLSLVPALKGR
jgi:hypothetical protein